MADPLCRYFGKCGGCTSQHIDYSIQLENKKKEISKAAGIADVKVFSGKEYGYRNRLDMLFSSRGIGMRKKENPGGVIEVPRCEIANEAINRILAEALAFFRSPDYADVKRRTGTLRYAVIRASGNTSCISFVMNSESNKIAEAVEKVKQFAERTTADNVVVAYTDRIADESISSDFFAVKGTEMLSETLLSKKFFFSSQGFFQNNTEMAEKMHEYCNSLLKKYDASNACLLDLFGGVGCFGIINSSLFKEVFIVENSAECIKAAKMNIKENNAVNCKAEIMEGSQIMKLPLKKPLFVVADPPRSGMGLKTIAALNSLKPEVIIYVSCSTSQLAKDLPKFSSYSVESAALFDLFPQTNHSEAVVELKLKK